jgi:hypothetical protein
MKCPNCGAHNEAFFKLCWKCGQPLLPASLPRPEAVNRLPDRNVYFFGRKVPPIIVIVVSLTFTCLCVAGVMASASKQAASQAEATQQAIATEPATALPTTTPMQPTSVRLASATNTLAAAKLDAEASLTRQSTTTPQATATPAFLSYSAIESAFNTMTDLQRTSYLQTLRGKRVHWLATVSDVDSSGEVSLEMGQSLFYMIYLDGVPQDVVSKFERNQRIQFDAVISKADSFIGLNIWLKFVSLTANVVITPTAIPIALTLDDLDKELTTMTSAQQKNYLETLVGKQVHWKGQVSDVSGSMVQLDMTGRSALRYVSLWAPGDEALRYSKGQILEFDATVTDTSDFLGLGVTLMPISVRVSPSEP